MAEVRAIPLPDGSVLHERRVAGDFLDCYAVASDASPREAAEIITDFPGWARGLLILRRVLTAPFGLDNDGPDVPDKIGPFPVESNTGTELIAGFDDRHLDFRVSVMAVAGRVSLATWVLPHNGGGRIYLAAIMPFHIAIAKDSLRRVATVQPARQTAGND
ncbi:DUF2867 domain-containing protein [Yoonia sp. 2307UL14-13]|uniref:DUF2867 domain-containing protein n=1 Tax=Yoonia sp. 2307UL14-13 TaxID=3126506 RepID=UPI00309DC40A